MIIKRYSLFGSSAKSTLTSDQGAFGNGDIKSGSRLDPGVEIKHSFSPSCQFRETTLFRVRVIFFSRLLGVLRGQGLQRALVTF